MGHHPWEGLLARLGAERAAARGEPGSRLLIRVLQLRRRDGSSLEESEREECGAAGSAGPSDKRMYVEQRQAFTSEGWMLHVRSDTY